MKDENASDHAIQLRLTHHALVLLYKACKAHNVKPETLEHVEAILRGDWNDQAIWRSPALQNGASE